MNTKAWLCLFWFLCFVNPPVFGSGVLDAIQARSAALAAFEYELKAYDYESQKIITDLESSLRLTALVGPKVESRDIGGLFLGDANTFLDSEISLVFEQPLDQLRINLRKSLLDLNRQSRLLNYDAELKKEAFRVSELIARLARLLIQKQYQQQLLVVANKRESLITKGFGTGSRSAIQYKETIKARVELEIQLEASSGGISAVVAELKNNGITIAIADNFIEPFNYEEDRYLALPELEKFSLDHDIGYQKLKLERKQLVFEEKFAQLGLRIEPRVFTSISYEGQLKDRSNLEIISLNAGIRINWDLKDDQAKNLVKDRYEMMKLAGDAKLDNAKANYDDVMTAFNGRMNEMKQELRLLKSQFQQDKLQYEARLKTYMAGLDSELSVFEAEINLAETLNKARNLYLQSFPLMLNNIAYLSNDQIDRIFESLSRVGGFKYSASSN